MEVQKGTVQNITDDKATVIPATHPDIVTQPLIVPFYWRKDMGNLQAGDKVYFFEDEEHGGQIIARVDGNWERKIDCEITVTGDITAEANVNASKDVKAGSISLKNHTHGGDSGGTTSTPK
jgi:bifunctional DNA-binding transcriptional regulator/antitoxin component of YhaV-PrlF toxin-antitoxin module